MSAEANFTTSANAPARPQPGSGKRVLSAAQLKLPNFITGRQGEHQACSFLKKHGFHIIATNVIAGKNEIDVVAFDQKHQEVVFIEVKKRNSSRFGNPSRAVNWKKRRGMAAAARAFLKKHRYDFDYRFDIISVTGNKIEHFENVTWNT